MPTYTYRLSGNKPVLMLYMAVLLQWGHKSKYLKLVYHAGDQFYVREVLASYRGLA